MTEDRTIAFVDLCGYTRMTGVHGDERAAEHLADFRTVVRRTVEEGCVQVVRWLGDGVFLAGDCAADIFVALGRIDDAGSSTGRLPVRAGVATGPVVAFDDDDMAGRTVNLAARLCDAATAHQILADRATATQLDEASAFQPLLVKGFDEPVDVFDVSACGHGERRSDPVCGMEIEDPPPVRLPGDDGDEVWFCGETCANRWRETAASGKAT